MADKTTELQNINDRMYGLSKILKRKQRNREAVTIQGEVLEELADEMRELLLNETEGHRLDEIFKTRREIRDEEKI